MSFLDALRRRKKPAGPAGVQVKLKSRNRPAGSERTARDGMPRRLILGGAMVSGMLLALAVHMLGARYGLDLGGLWRSDSKEFMPAGAAIAWWLIATAGFAGGYYGRPPYSDGLYAIAVPLIAGKRVYGAINLLWLRQAGTVESFARSRLAELKSAAGEIVASLAGARV